MKPSPKSVTPPVVQQGHRYADLPPAAQDALEKIQELIEDLAVVESAMEGLAAVAENSQIEPETPRACARMVFKLRDRIIAEVDAALGTGGHEGGAR
jgi:hypothetical protein